MLIAAGQKSELAKLVNYILSFSTRLRSWSPTRHDHRTQRSIPTIREQVKVAILKCYTRFHQLG